MKTMSAREFLIEAIVMMETTGVMPSGAYGGTTLHSYGLCYMFTLARDMGIIKDETFDRLYSLMWEVPRRVPHYKLLNYWWRGGWAKPRIAHLKKMLKRLDGGAA